ATGHAGKLVLAPNPAWKPGPQPAQPTVNDDGECPYRGLNSYREGDAAYFFGREALTGRLLERLANQLPGDALLVLTAPSGSGKPRLRRPGFLPAPDHTGLPALPSPRAWPRMVIIPGVPPLATLPRKLAPLTGDTPDPLRARLTADPTALRSAAETA